MYEPLLPKTNLKLNVLKTNNYLFILIKQLTKHIPYHLIKSFGIIKISHSFIAL